MPQIAARPYRPCCATICLHASESSLFRCARHANKRPPPGLIPPQNRPTSAPQAARCAAVTPPAPAPAAPDPRPLKGVPSFIVPEHMGILCKQLFHPSPSLWAPPTLFSQKAMHAADCAKLGAAQARKQSKVATKTRTYLKIV